MNSSLTNEVAIAQPELMQHLEQLQEALALQPEVRKKFRQGYREEAVDSASKTKEAAALATQTILKIADQIQGMRSRLNRKEFGTFVRDLLQWSSNEAQKYLDIARAFNGFEPSRLACLEPLTVVKLRSKRYAPVVERLRCEPVITHRVVQNLIQELLPRQVRQKKSKADYLGEVLTQHVNADDGTFYFTLKNVNLSEKSGFWLQEKLETQTVGQVLEQAAQMEASMLASQVRSLQARNQELETQLQQQAQQLAELQARLEQVEETKQQEVQQEEAAIENEISDSQEPSSPQLIQNLTTWEDFANFVGHDRNRLLRIAKHWTLEQRQILVKLLGTYLKQEPANALEHVSWVPKKLLDKALLVLATT